MLLSPGKKHAAILNESPQRNSAMHRRNELKTKKYQSIRKGLRNCIVNERSVAHWKSELSILNSKTADATAFKSFIELKLHTNSLVTPFYEER